MSLPTGRLPPVTPVLFVPLVLLVLLSGRFDLQLRVAFRPVETGSRRRVFRFERQRLTGVPEAWDRRRRVREAAADPSVVEIPGPRIGWHQGLVGEEERIRPLRRSVDEGGAVAAPSAGDQADASFDPSTAGDALGPPLVNVGLLVGVFRRQRV